MLSLDPDCLLIRIFATTFLSPGLEILSGFVRFLVRPLVHRSIHHDRVENAKTRIFDAAVVIVCVCVRGFGRWGGGEAGD